MTLNTFSLRVGLQDAGECFGNVSKHYGVPVVSWKDAVLPVTNFDGGFGAASDATAPGKPFSTKSLWQVPQDWNVGHHPNALGRRQRGTSVRRRPTSKAPLSVVCHSFRLSFQRTIVARSSLEA